MSLGPRCLPQGAPTSPALTNTLCLRLDRRISGLAHSLGYRYTRYAVDLTFSLPADHKGKPRPKALLGVVRRVVEAEGIPSQPRKDTHSPPRRTAAGDGAGRATAAGRQRCRGAAAATAQAAVHNLGQGKPLKEGETVDRLLGYAAYVHMTNPELGGKLLASFRNGK